MENKSLINVEQPKKEFPFVLHKTVFVGEKAEEIINNPKLTEKEKELMEFIYLPLILCSSDYDEQIRTLLKLSIDVDDMVKDRKEGVKNA